MLLALLPALAASDAPPYAVSPGVFDPANPGATRCQPSNEEK